MVIFLTLSVDYPLTLESVHRMKTNDVIIHGRKKNAHEENALLLRRHKWRGDYKLHANNSLIHTEIQKKHWYIR